MPTLSEKTSENTKELQSLNRETRFKILDVIGFWVHQYFEDFILDATLLSDLNKLLGFIEKAGYSEFVSELNEEIRIQTEGWEGAQRKGSRDTAQSDQLRHNIHHFKGFISTIEPKELAEQLCIYNLKQFLEIKHVEFLANMRKGKSDEANFLFKMPNLTKFIARFDIESKWVQKEILNQTTAKGQALVISNFIEVAVECLALSNFNSIFAIIGGLNFPKVRELKEAWEQVPKKQIKAKKTLEDDILDPSRNMKKYRTYLSRCQSGTSYVPFIPVLLKDLLFFNDGNSDHVEGMVNFDKLRMITSHLQNIEIAPYPFPVLKDVQIYLALAGEEVL